MIIGDLDDAFAPLPMSRLGLNVVLDRERIDLFLDKLIALYQTEDRMKLPNVNCFGAAMAASIDLLKGIGGRVIAFNSGPVGHGVGPLKDRANTKIYNQAEEYTMFKHTD